MSKQFLGFVILLIFVPNRQPYRGDYLRLSLDILNNEKDMQTACLVEVRHAGFSFRLDFSKLHTSFCEGSHANKASS